MQRLLPVLIIALFAGFLAKPVLAAGLEVDNITVATQAADGVQARDMAINKAQRLAFGALVGKTDADIARINDNQIARLVKGFSVQGEKSTAHAYRANFTIRFLQAATNNFLMSNGFEMVPQAQNGEAIAFDNNAAAAAGTNTATAPSGADQPVQPKTGQQPVPAAATTAPTQNIVILPVLDIGSRRIVWDDPNPWRDAWQETDHGMQGIIVTVPLGDVDDVTDIPDASFLNENGGNANAAHMLQRYNAGKLYVVVAKNMGAALDTEGGMSLTLYSHDGQKLKFVRKMIVHPRPGYLFNDAVPAALQMIASAGSNGTTTINSDVLESQNADAPMPVQAPAAAPVAAQSIPGGKITVTIPYQSLQQWVSIQRRLRSVPGITAVMPVRVSSSSAQVKIITTTSNTDDLSRNLSMQKFGLQKMANGEIILTEQP